MADGYRPLFGRSVPLAQHRQVGAAAPAAFEQANRTVAAARASSILA
jgi:hypothetical protein